MIPWKIYYDDDSTYPKANGAAGDWTTAQTHGVICVVVFDTTEQWGRFVNSGYAPHHVRTNAEFFVCYPDSTEPFVTWDLAPFKDRMATLFPREDLEKFIKYGRQTDQLHWQSIMNTAAADKDFPTATSPRRRVTDFPEIDE